MSSIGIKPRKFQFFDEVEETKDKNDINENNIIEEKKEEDKDKEKIKLKKLNISISSIAPFGRMQCLDDVIFLCATVFYEEKKTKGIRFLKIYNNQVIDEYIMFNKYINFQLMQLQDKPLLIVVGSMKKIIENLKEITSIKFYNIANFIENKDSPYAVIEKINDVVYFEKVNQIQESNLYICSVSLSLKDSNNNNDLINEEFLIEEDIPSGKKSFRYVIYRNPNI